MDQQKLSQCIFLDVQLDVWITKAMQFSFAMSKVNIVLNSNTCTCYLKIKQNKVWERYFEALNHNLVEAEFCIALSIVTGSCIQGIFENLLVQVIYWFAIKNLVISWSFFSSPEQRSGRAIVLPTGVNGCATVKVLR